MARLLANSMARTTININVNLQQSISIRKNSVCIKRQETFLHINDSPRSDFCKALKGGFSQKSCDALPCFSEPCFDFPTLVRTHATTPIHKYYNCLCFLFSIVFSLLLPGNDFFLWRATNF